MTTFTPRAVLFLALGQSELTDMSFGLWLAHGVPQATALQAAIVFTFWMFLSWSVWTCARQRFWPADFER